MNHQLDNRGFLIRLLGFRENRFDIGDIVATPDGGIGAIAEFEMRGILKVWVRVLWFDGWEDWYDLRDCAHAKG